jgi:hypothetical protein
MGPDGYNWGRLFDERTRSPTHLTKAMVFIYALGRFGMIQSHDQLFSATSNAFVSKYSEAVSALSAASSDLSLDHTLCLGRY